MSTAVESVTPTLPTAPFRARKSSLSPLQSPQADDTTGSLIDSNDSFLTTGGLSTNSDGASLLALPRLPPRKSSLSSLQKPADWTEYLACVSTPGRMSEDEIEEKGTRSHGLEYAEPPGQADEEVVVIHGLGVGDSLVREGEIQEEGVLSSTSAGVVLFGVDGSEMPKILASEEGDDSSSEFSINDRENQEVLEEKGDEEFKKGGSERPNVVLNDVNTAVGAKRETVMKVGSEQRPLAPTDSPTPSPERPTRRTRAPNSLSSRFRRKSWMPSSRSPSPKKQNQLDSQSDSLEVTSGVNSLRRDRLNTVISSSGRPSTRSASFSKQISSKLQRRQSSHSALDTLADTSLNSTSTEKLVPTLPKSQSSDRLSSAPQIMPILSSDRLSSLAGFTLSSKTRQARKRDELWSSFRDIDGACTRFQNKTGEQKANIVKTSLLPFLQDKLSQLTPLSLHVEDLDRRLSILHNWWTALLDFLKSRTFSSITSQSKYAIIDAILEIMERPEWKVFPSSFCPPKNKPPKDISESTSEVDFINESVQHNIVTWFTQALTTQMTVAIEKMSMRSAPNLITFAGRTCAYAFFYCPGVADVLIRLWNLKYGTLKRVMEENGIDTSTNLKHFSHLVSSALPPAWQKSQFSTLAEAYKTIRKPASYPLGTQDSQWRGPWIDRWSGQDSELFYVFLKHYYLILADFIPDASKTEKLVAAGGLFVQAQILVNLDATIRRRFPRPVDLSSLPSQNKGQISRTIDEPNKSPTITFDDMLGDIDAAPSAALAGLNFNQGGYGPLTNVDRNITENRLIQLLKDMLAVRKNPIPRFVREGFAYMINDLLRAAAKATPQYNRLDTETLCAFLEETVDIFVTYERSHRMHTAFLDWEFWFGVWKIMSKNNFFATETRIYSLIHALWPAITQDPGRKAELCYGFLLEKDHFESRFCHWSSMVRSYFMRLICWRVARVHEDCDENDLKILACLLQRLKEVHAHYMYLHEKAVELSSMIPNTTPACAMPSRKFIIIRGDRPSPLLAAFDSSTANASFKRAVHLEQLYSQEFAPETDELVASSGRPQTATSGASTDEDLEDSPKRWTGGGLFRSLMGNSKTHSRSKSRSPSRAGPDPPRPPTSTPASQARSGSRASTFEPGEASFGDGAPSGSRQVPSFKKFCFRFSLELIDRRGPPPGPMTLHTPRLPQPAQTLLMRYLRGLAIGASPAGPSSENSSASSDDAASGSTAGSRFSDDRATEEHRLQLQQWLPPVVVARASGSSAAREMGAYCGRALAEWAGVVQECHVFFERRKAEGVPGNRYVETPFLGASEAGRGPRG
jgi:uncharacterized protein DUF1765